MSYTHDGRRPVKLRRDPVDPDSTEWVFFSYGGDLMPTETITSHTAIIVGGTVETDSTYIGDLVDAKGTTYSECYGVQFSVEEGTPEVSITHRTSRSIASVTPLVRTDIDRTIVIPVRSL